MSYLIPSHGQQQRSEVNQVRNNAGGFVYAVDPWVQLDRFLILGSQNGTYYAKQETLTKQNAEIVEQLLSKDPEGVVKRIVELSEAGRAPKQDTLLFALAMAVAHPDDKARTAAFEAMSRVCRTASQLYQFLSYADSMRGWGMGFRKALTRWLVAKNPQQLAYQMVKYRARSGWAGRDILRKTKPSLFKNPETEQEQQYDAIFKFIAREWSEDEVGHYLTDDALKVISAYEIAKTQNDRTLDKITLASMLPHEAVPTEWKREAEVWRAMLPKMGLTAVLRNLATMTRVGVFNDGEALNFVFDRVLSKEGIRKSRVHPAQFLSAWLTYKSGRSVRGSSTWTPLPDLVHALEQGFYFAFGNVDPANSRISVGLDVSGSMGHPDMLDIPGLSPRVAAAALCMIQWRTEPHVQFNMFSDNYKRLDMKEFDENARLEQLLNKIHGLPFQRTDCSLPMRAAAKNGWLFDTFVIYTDNETWYGDVKPMDALRQYRQQTGIDAKLVTVGMTSTGFTIGDPNDAGTLDVVGFDLSTPALIADFARTSALTERVEG